MTILQEMAERRGVVKPTPEVFKRVTKPKTYKEKLAQRIKAAQERARQLQIRRGRTTEIRDGGFPSLEKSKAVQAEAFKKVGEERKEVEKILEPRILTKQTVKQYPLTRHQEIVTERMKLGDVFGVHAPERKAEYVGFILGQTARRVAQIPKAILETPRSMVQLIRDPVGSVKGMVQEIRYDPTVLITMYGAGKVIGAGIKKVSMGLTQPKVSPAVSRTGLMITERAGRIAKGKGITEAGIIYGKTQIKGVSDFGFAQAKVGKITYGVQAGKMKIAVKQPKWFGLGTKTKTVTEKFGGVSQTITPDEILYFSKGKAGTLEGITKTVGIGKKMFETPTEARFSGMFLGKSKTGKIAGISQTAIRDVSKIAEPKPFTVFKGEPALMKMQPLKAVPSIAESTLLKQMGKHIPKPKAVETPFISGLKLDLPTAKRERVLMQTDVGLKFPTAQKTKTLTGVKMDLGLGSITGTKQTQKQMQKELQIKGIKETELLDTKISTRQMQKQAQKLGLKTPVVQPYHIFKTHLPTQPTTAFSLFPSTVKQTIPKGIFDFKMPKFRGIGTKYVPSLTPKVLGITARKQPKLTRLAPIQFRPIITKKKGKKRKKDMFDLGF